MRYSTDQISGRMLSCSGGRSGSGDGNMRSDVPALQRRLLHSHRCGLVFILSGPRLIAMLLRPVHHVLLLRLLLWTSHLCSRSPGGGGGNGGGGGGDGCIGC